MNMLEIKGLNKALGDFRLEDISLELPKGYVMGYIGQNGAGKTTTIRLINQQLKPDSGMIRVAGSDFKEDEAAYKDQIGYVAETCYYPEHFTMEMVERVMQRFYPSFDPEKFAGLAVEWGIDRYKKVGKFSKGMKIKLMLAAVLARDAKLLLLDEPTGGLDPVIRKDVLAIIQEFIEDGERSVLFSTHNMDDLQRIADYICFIDQGRLLLKGEKDNLLEDYVIIKGGSEELTDVCRERLIGYSVSDVSFEGLLESSLLEQGLAAGLTVERPDIEQIFIYHIKGKGRSYGYL